MLSTKGAKSLSFSLIFLILTGTFACNHQRNVVPFESDSEDIFEPLAPNDEDIPEGMTYGPDSIPGFSLQVEMLSDSTDVYVNISQFTDIDDNPKITMQLLDFIRTRLQEFGFVGPQGSDNAELFSELLTQKKSQEESVDSVFKIFRKDFEKKIPELNGYGSAFNITFDVYPVYIDKKYVTFLQSAYCYTGGAHGTQIIELCTYELSDGEKLTLDKLFIKDALPQVREEVAAHMAYSYPIYDNIRTVDQYIDSLNIWLGTGSADEEGNAQDVITVQNFPLPQPALNNTGVVFVYPIYELTPGSDGCPVVVLTYPEIKNFLQPDFTK